MFNRFTYRSANARATVAVSTKIGSPVRLALISPHLHSHVRSTIVVIMEYILWSARLGKEIRRGIITDSLESKLNYAEMIQRDVLE